MGILRRAGGGSRDFLAHGMLLNVLLSLRAPGHLAEGGALGVLTTCTFGDALPLSM